MSAPGGPVQFPAESVRMPSHDAAMYAHFTMLPEHLKDCIRELIHKAFEGMMSPGGGKRRPVSAGLRLGGGR